MWVEGQKERPGLGPGQDARGFLWRQITRRAARLSRLQRQMTSRGKVNTGAGTEGSMHKTIVAPAAGLTLLVTALLTLNANAVTFTAVRTPFDSPVQPVACWCGVLGGSTAALRGGRSYKCSCSTARALRAPPHMPCFAHRTQFYCKANLGRWDSSRMICI